MKRRYVLCLWGVYPLILLASSAQRYGIFDGLILALACLCLISIFLLGQALRCDSDLVVLSGFLKSRFGKSLAIIVSLALAATGLKTSLVAVTALAMLIACWFFACWATSTTVDSLLDKCKRFLLLIISCAVACALGELVFRVPQVADSLTPYAHRFKNEWWNNEDYDHNSFHPWRGRTFRSLHLGESKRTDELRILVLGDSYTWGDKIRDTRRTWPYVLERELSEQSISNQVISLAHRGDTTVNELEYLQEFGWELDPDIVIVQYYLNDPLPSAPGFQRKGEVWMKAEVVPLAVSVRLHKRLNRRSNLYSFINHEWENALRTLFRLKNMNLASLHEDSFLPWQKTKTAIRQMAAECRQREVSFLFVVLPICPKGSQLTDYPFIRLHHKLRLLVEGEGVPFLDLLPVYVEVNPEAEYWRALPTDGHPSTNAHRLVGLTIAAKLKQIGALSNNPYGR